jgi:hypothetical protein
MKSILLLVLLSSVALAQPAAKITGPTTTPPGELVVLSSTGSTGENLVWVKPDNLQTLSVGCTLLDSQIVFATTKPGRYEFWLIVADKEAKIDYARHVVEVKTGSTQPPPVDPPPVDPPPTDPSKWANLKTLSQTNATKINDSTTRSRLKAAIAAAILEIDSESLTLEASKDRVRKAIELTLVTRTGASTAVDWTPWRKGNQSEIDKLGLVDVKDYVLAVRAISSGL